MYGFNVTLKTTVPEAINRVKDALATEGFGVLSEIDVAGTLNKKLDLDRRPYHILGACNPKLASQALEADADIGLLLPCNVIVREEENGQVTVGFMDPVAVLALVDKEGIAQLANEVRSRLERVRDLLTAV
jgi:uncharacterized protein (DUF302 family)